MTTSAQFGHVEFVNHFDRFGTLCSSNRRATYIVVKTLTDFPQLNPSISASTSISVISSCFRFKLCVQNVFFIAVPSVYYESLLPFLLY